MKDIFDKVVDVYKSDKYFWTFLFVIFPLVMYANYAGAVEAQGVSRFKNESLTNAYIAAHFKCNRKGLWADLNTLKVKNIDTFQYKIVGGKRLTTDYITNVEFECTTVFMGEPSE